jgi:hypothetical protein
LPAAVAVELSGVLNRGIVDVVQCFGSALTLCGSGSSFLGDCGSGSRLQNPDPGYRVR